MSARALAWSVRAALAIPFVVALVALAGSHWSPVLDLAMTELRVRDVLGPHTPLIGLPGRIVRELTDEEVANLQLSADRYVAQWRRYVRELGSPL